MKSCNCSLKLENVEGEVRRFQLMIEEVGKRRGIFEVTTLKRECLENINEKLDHRTCLVGCEESLKIQAIRSLMKDFLKNPEIFRTVEKTDHYFSKIERILIPA